MIVTLTLEYLVTLSSPTDPSISKLPCLSCVISRASSGQREFPGINSYRILSTLYLLRYRVDHLFDGSHHRGHHPLERYLAREGFEPKISGEVVER